MDPGWLYQSMWLYIYRISKQPLGVAQCQENLTQATTGKLGWRPGKHYQDPSQDLMDETEKVISYHQDISQCLTHSQSLV